jgi:hypothetical protein
VFYDVNRGWPIHFYGGTNSAVTVANNTFAEKAPTPPGVPAGHIMIAGGWTGASIFRNNISYDPLGSAPFTTSAATTGAGTISVGYTLTDGSDSNMWFTTVPTQVSGVSPIGTNIINSSTINFTNASSDLYSLATSSAAINAGTAVTGITCNGTCDIGAYETFGFSSASIDTNVMDVQLGMSVNTPLLPSSGITGFTVSCSGSGCGAPVVADAALKAGTDSVVRLTISGITGNACAVGQTWTVSYSGGNVTDSANIGGTYQPLLAFSGQSVTDVCTGSGTTPPSGGLEIHYKFDDGSSGATPTTAADEVDTDDGTLTGGATWTTGHDGNAVNFDLDTNDTVTVPYGSGVNPSTQSLSVCMGVLPDANAIGTNRNLFGSPIGTNQRFYLSWDSNGVAATWGMGVQSSGSSSVTPTEFAVTAAWTRVCMVFNSSTDTATLWVNGVKGAVSGASVKTYTSFYTLSGNVVIGTISGVSTSTAGAAIDEFKLYTAALTDQEVADDYAAWEPASPTPTGTYSQVGHQWQLVRKKVDLTAQDYGAASATVPVVVGGAISLVTQIDCTVANCDPSGLRLYYSCAACDTAGAWLPVPDVASGDGVSFFGNNADSDFVTGTVECCLSGALTENDGTTQLTASAVPIFDIGQDASFVRRSIIRFASSVTAGRTYCFKEYHQTDIAMDSYTPSGGACVTISSMSAGVGF